MELLDGEELKRLIARRTPMALEQKVSVMAQVCDGLHYAHQKGVVHRDIKPGNIMLLRSGQVKILDFGIAQIANTAGDLTRTGLIMGTLRYIAPEQVRGRADYRSDIFSVGAVFYEFLSLQPPFGGDDPMQLLEQLRIEDPTPLGQLVPGIPTELAGVVERAMRKHPDERFPNLQQMRARLEQVQRELADEAQRIGARVRSQYDRLRELQRALAERIGSFGPEETRPPLEQPESVAALQVLEREIEARIHSVQGQIERADVLAPALEHGTELLEAEQFAAAEAELAAIVAEMPEHARAAEGLRRAKAGVDTERRRRLTAQLLQDARRALSEGEYTLCLEILEQVSAIPAPEEAGREIAALRETAEKLTAIQEARRARQLAEQSREKMAPARRAAQAEAAAQYAPALWNEAEAKSAEAEQALAAERYADAGSAFEAAAAGYGRSAEAARDAQSREREALDRARVEAAQSKDAARAAEATRYAEELWDVAEFKFAEAEAAARAGREVRAGAVANLFSDARRLYAAAARAARLAAEAEGRRVDALLSEARALLASADAAQCLVRVNEVLALRPGDSAAERLREQAREKQRESAAATARVMAAPDVTLVPEQAVPDAEVANPADATELIVAPPAMVGPISVDVAAEPALARVPIPPIAEPAAQAPDRPRLGDAYARQPIDRGPEIGWTWSRWARGILTVVAVLTIVVAVSVYGVPHAPPHKPELTPGPIEEVQKPIEEAQKQVNVARGEAAGAKAESLAQAQFAAAKENERQGDLALAQQQTEVARQRYQEALQGYRKAQAEAEARTDELRAKARAAEQRAEEAKRAGERQNVASVEGESWTQALLKQRHAEEAFKQDAFDRAERLFAEAEQGYLLAAKHAQSRVLPPIDPGFNKPKAQAEQPKAKAEQPKAQAEQPKAQAEQPKAQAEQAKVGMAKARRAAEGAAANFYAPKLFKSAQDKEEEAATAFKRPDYDSAIQLFAQAQAAYEAAEQEAKKGAEAARLEEIVQGVRGDTLTRQAEAIKAGADRLAKDVFERAESKHREADRLANARDHQAAVKAYREAAKLYQDAMAASQG
jgi:protein kinase-like protein